MGAPETAIAETRARLAQQAIDPVVVVHPSNVPAVRMLMVLASQWRTVALGTYSKAQLVRVGLDYGSIEPAARLAGLALTADDFGRLRFLEAACLEAWAEARRLER